MIDADATGIIKKSQFLLAFKVMDKRGSIGRRSSTGAVYRGSLDGKRSTSISGASGVAAAAAAAGAHMRLTCVC